MHNKSLVPMGARRLTPLNAALATEKERTECTYQSTTKKPIYPFYIH